MMQRKRWKTKLFAMAITITMVAGLLSGCGKGDSKTVSKMDKDHVYRAEYITVPEGMKNINRLTVANNRIYYDGYDESDYLYRIMSVKFDGTDLKEEFNQNDSQNLSVSSFSFDQSGNLSLIAQETIYDDKDPENIINKSKYYLINPDKDGKGSKKLEFKLKQKEDFYPQSVVFDKEDNCILMSYQSIKVFDLKGKELFSLDVTDNQIDTMFLTEDGKVMAVSYGKDYSGKELKELLIKEKKFSEPKKLDGGFNFTFYFGVGYDAMMKDNENLYGYDTETGEKTKILNWIDSDINGSFINNLVPITEGRFVCATNNYMKNTSELAVLTKVKPEDVVEKSILNLFCLYLDYQLSSTVIEFNKKNDKYRISIKDYSTYNTETDYMAGQKKLNSDIISGNIPDILLVSDMSSFNNLCEKGFFADYYELMKNDSEIKQSDYLENIFKAFEKDGKLFTMTPYYNIFTVIGKASNVGTKQGWNLDDLEALIASKPKDTQVIANTSQTQILYYGSYLSVNDFVDWNSGKCDFENPEFIKLLEFAKKFPSDKEMQNKMAMASGGMSSSSSTGSGKIVHDYSNDELAYRKDKILLEVNYLNGFNDFHRTQKITFGEEVTFIGFPTSSKNGSAISPNLQLAISEKSRAKDVAWDYVKMFMSDDFQDGLDYGWPIKISSLEKKKEKERKPQTYKDENGKEQTYKEMFMLNGKEVELGLTTDEECQKLIDFIKSLNRVVRYDQKINDIISEEASAFFAGQKQASETAKLIQNRVQTYVNETK